MCALTEVWRGGAARLASESGPGWDDSSHTTQTKTHKLMTTGEITAHITHFMGFTDNALQWMLLIKSSRSGCAPLINELL